MKPGPISARQSRRKRTRLLRTSWFPSLLRVNARELSSARPALEVSAGPGGASWLPPGPDAPSSPCRMPWQGDTNNMIDRFDVRAHLDYIPLYTPPLLNPM